VNPQRIRALNNCTEKAGPIVYWMQRDQRTEDNWALLYAQEIATSRKQPLIVVFNVVSAFLGANSDQFQWMLQGLQEVFESLKQKNIWFYMVEGDPTETIPKFVQNHGVGTLVTDFSPLRLACGWKESVAGSITVPLYEVDAHNVIPCWTSSSKQEFGAYTFRPKVHRLLPEFLEDYLELEVHPYTYSGQKRGFKSNSSSYTQWFQSGETAAKKALENFILTKLSNYSDNRNNPAKHGQSDLSPYLHFGQISAARIVLEINKTPLVGEEYLEELIVRKELSDNFCHYNMQYDSVSGFPAWALKTIDEHRCDVRPILYTDTQLENAETHDDLWNAAQIEMVKKGKMHGYMRMYWAKKILEWTESPEEALRIAIHNNDTYSLDGRDPNGYTGIAWSIGGVHDRAWFDRPIFGKIRYMNYNGCKSKFSIPNYITYVHSL
jgi:deoxyribodipyrimidine photo-lyase